MKIKIFSLLLTLILCLGIFCACGGSNQGTNTEQNTNTGSTNTGSTNTDEKTETEEPGEGTEEGGEKEPEYTVGTSVGEKLPSYQVQIFDGDGKKPEFIDPSALGKVTVINFWGIWCGPCKNELPEFSEVATEYKDSVVIVAVHSVNSIAAAPSYVKEYYSDSDIVFAADEDLKQGNVYRDECYETFGGDGYYPYTIIVDENGVITYADSGAISKAKLAYEIENALGN